MDFPIEDLSASNDATFPFPMLHPTTFWQPDELQASLASGGQALETFPAPRLVSGESYMPPFEEGYMLASPDIFAALNAPSQNTPLPNNTVKAANISIDPPPRARKKKAGTLKARDWEQYKSYIKQIYYNQGLSLEEVKSRIESEFGFKAELRQYRYRISQWGLDRNIKPREIKAIIRKRQNRKFVERNKQELAFTVRGREVDLQKIDRWTKRNNISESLIYASSPTISTPSAIYCRTVSEHSSTPQAFSPAMSNLTNIQSARKFTGQSPALFGQPLPSLGRGAISSHKASLESPVLPQPNYTGDTPKTPDVRWGVGLVSLQSALFRSVDW